MTKPNHKKQKTIVIISIIMIFFGGYNFGEQIINPESLVLAIDKIGENSTDKSDFKGIVTSFCNSIGSDGIYDSNQSLFVYYLCKESDTKKGQKNKKFLKLSKGDLALIESLEEELPSEYHNTEEYVQKTFDSIIANYTTIFQASIFGYSPNDEEEIDSIVHKNFAAKYLKKDELKYLSICSADNPDEYHPKTCKKIKEYIYSARNSVNSDENNYLNTKEIFSIQSDCKDNKNILYCGLFNKDITMFTKLIYNEMMFYALFVEYYGYALQNKSDFKNIDGISFSRKLANNQNKINSLIDNLNNSREAMQITIKRLKELQSTYPIHIGFLLYNESIYKYTSSMNKLLTPIYTLYDIFRNVQKTN